MRDAIPVLPSANLTSTGFSMALNALKYATLMFRRRKARKAPSVTPKSEPNDTWRDTFSAALRRVSRSDCVKLGEELVLNSV